MLSLSEFQIVFLLNEVIEKVMIHLKIYRKTNKLIDSRKLKGKN